MPPVIEGLSNLEEVGRGGFGVVYRAEDVAHRRMVAVKVLRETLDDAGRARFERECRAAASVSGHPNIVSFHGSGVTADGEPFLVMDLLPGGSLADRVEAGGPRPAAEVVDLGVGLASALAAAHGRGIVHRDLKPENILYSEFGQPQLVDFGIARMVSEFETRTGSISASLAHAPPEVIAGSAPSLAGDIYSLGSVLHYALAGAAPFSVAGEESLAPLIARISGEDPPDLRELGVPEPLAACVEPALAKPPEDRYETATAMGEALRDAARTLGISVPALAVAVPSCLDGGTATRWSPPAPARAGSRRSDPPSGPLTVDLTAAATAPEPAPTRRRWVVLGLAAALVVGLVVVVMNRGTGKDALATVGSTTTTTAAPSVLPAAPTGVLVAQPTFLGDDNFRVSVKLSWTAPRGGPAITGYRIRHRQRWSDGCDQPAGADQPEVIDVGPATSSTQYSDTEMPCGWVAWEVAAVSEGGAGPFAPATGVVPDVVGVEKSFHLVRAVGGLASGTTRVGCDGDRQLACETSPSAGTRINPGTLVAVTLPP